MTRLRAADFGLRTSTFGMLLLAGPALSLRSPQSEVRSQVQGIVAVSGPAGDTLRELTPTFRVRTAGFAAMERPLMVGLQIATRSDFTGPLLVDTTLFADSAVITIPRPLPERTRIYWRGRARTAQAQDVFSEATGPREVPAWVTLVSPNAPNGTTVGTRRPQFVWSALAVTSPPGPWTFDLSIARTNSNEVRTYAGLTDTVFTVPAPLEGNAPYRWSVLARLASGDTARARSAATFVVSEPGSPLVTLLYQNFPNPFPSRTSATTCIWFNLKSQADVRLEIYDLRGNKARTLVPGPNVPSVLTPGRYGRASSDTEAGCDERFAWDGTGDDGRQVPAGVYVVRLRAGATEQYRKVLFRGR